MRKFYFGAKIATKCVQSWVVYTLGNPSGETRFGCEKLEQPSSLVFPFSPNFERDLQKCATFHI